MGKTKIALIGDALYKWDGGIDFLTNIAVVLNAVSAGNDLQLILFLPKDSLFTKAVKKILLGENATDEARKKRLIQNFRDANVKFGIVHYPKMPRQPFMRDKGKRLDRIFQTLGIDAALPVMIESYPAIKTPWISYIPDLQEKYFPELFAEKELQSRDAMYRRILRDAQYVLATSDSVKKDIEKYYPDAMCKVFATPFAPIAPEKYIDTDGVNMDQYALPPRYFVISNQFWAHKSHDTAFKALELLYEKGERDVHLFCTGVLQDYRTDDYRKSLRKLLAGLRCKKNIHLLGFIPKMEQIELIKRSCALIQPSLFEGDCGGCSVYLARSLCVPSILSDIPVNLEGQGDKYLHYFQAGNAASLAEQMRKLIGLPEKRAPEIIQAGNKENMKKLGKFYLDMLQEVIAEYSGKQ